MQIIHSRDLFSASAGLAPLPGNTASNAAKPLDSADAGGDALTASGSGLAANGIAKGAGADLDNMTLESQVQLGKALGVFTKVTISSEGLAMSKLDQSNGLRSPEFVASAVATMKDFEEGLAAMKGSAQPTASKAAALFAGRFQNLQQAAARLNLFA